MAKKKKKSKLMPIISIIIVLAIIIAGVFTFLLLKTPNAEKLSAKYKDKDYISLGFIGDKEKDIGNITGTTLKDTFTITFFEKTEDAKKLADAAEDKKVVIRRGRAVFVGTEGAAKIFKGFIG